MGKRRCEDAAPEAVLDLIARWRETAVRFAVESAPMGLDGDALGRRQADALAAWEARFPELARLLRRSQQ